MMRVPGTRKDLLSAKAEGGNLRLVYSPMDALEPCQSQILIKEVVFFAVGFETTAPANAMAVYQARQQEIHNFSVLVSHVRVPPAIESILASPREQAFKDFYWQATSVPLWVGRNTIISYKSIRIPLVVTGFEPLDILQGVYMCIEQLEQGRTEIDQSIYPRGKPGMETCMHRT